MPIRNNDFDTAEMLKRLQRQVSRIRARDVTESVTVIVQMDDTEQSTDSLSATIDTNPGWVWGESDWGYDSW